MSYQPEERYWTDYVRVALPIVGLLVLLGVFWYWASSLIGSASTTEPTARATIELVNAPTNTPSPTEEVDLPVNTPEETPEPEPTDEAPPEETPPPAEETPKPEPTETEPEPTTAPDPGEKCVLGGTVVVIDDDVNMREEPSREAGVIEVLTQGTELMVIGESQENGGLIWCNVEDEANSRTGWVADDWLEPQS